jgi:hypothetical protein
MWKINCTAFHETQYLMVRLWNFSITNFIQIFQATWKVLKEIHLCPKLKLMDTGGSYPEGGAGGKEAGA